MGAIRAMVAAVLMLISAAVFAADCVTASRVLSTRASVPNLVAGPSAWSGSVLAVAKTSEASPNEIWLAVYAEGLETLVNDRRIAADANDATSIVALLWNGTEFGLFYRTDDRIHLQRLTMMGESIGAPVVVNPGRRPQVGDDIEVVWSAALDAWVVARHIGSGTNRGIWITLLEDDGAERDDYEIAAVPPTDPHLALAVTDTGVIGLFYLTEDDNTLVFTRVSPGKFPDSRSVASAGTQTQAVADGDLFVVARLVGEGPTAEIRWLVVDTDFHLVRPDDVLVAGGPRLLLGLLRNDAELALTYGIPLSALTAIPDLRLRRFTLAGALISDTLFAGADLIVGRALSTYPPTWTGTSYITEAVREITSRLDSYLVRYCPLRAEITGPRVVLVGQPVTLTTEVSGGVSDYDYAWTVTRDPGGSKTRPTLQRTFFATGTRVATLVVTDETGATTTESFTLEVVEEIEVVTKKRRAVRK